MEKKPLFEKYRPKTLSEVINQERVKQVLQEYVKKGDMPHLMFLGPPGVGKTTMAHALANDLGWPIVEYNASDERGINVIREDIKQVAFARGRKIILLDEADALTEDAQQALRRIMEKSIKAGTRFILTGNFEWKIIDALKSRCAIFRFERLPRDLVIRRLIEIVLNELGGVVEEDVPKLRQAVTTIYEVTEGDMRKALNLLEEIITSTGRVTVEAIERHIKPGMVELAVKYAYDGDFDTAVATLEKAVVESGLDASYLVNEMYRAILKLGDEGARIALRDLAGAERGIKMGASPLIQLTGVLTRIWERRVLNGR